MHCSTSSNPSRASAVLVTIFALFTSVCIGVPAAGSSAILPRGSCDPNRNYTVVAKDTCQKIALKQSVSTDQLIALNCLKPDGTDLKANSTILLPGCCSTYTVKHGDDCTSIASTRNLTLPDFYAFNPTLSRNCSNLKYDRNVCLTAPQGTPFNPPPCPAKRSGSRFVDMR